MPIEITISRFLFFVKFFLTFFLPIFLTFLFLLIICALRWKNYHWTGTTDLPIVVLNFFKVKCLSYALRLYAGWFLKVLEELYTCLVRKAQKSWEQLCWIGRPGRVVLTDFAIKKSNRNTLFSQQLILYMFCIFYLFTR